MRTKKSQFGNTAVLSRSKPSNFNTVLSIHQKEKRSQNENLPKINARRSIVFVSENSSYYRLRSYLLGKHVKLVKQTEMGWICEFVNDDDRVSLNDAAGWSDTKIQYLFDCVKFKD